jgi:hypothetical protein
MTGLYFIQLLILFIGKIKGNSVKTPFVFR